MWMPGPLAGGDGTSGAPFTSIATGVSAAAANSGADSLMIHPGVYSENPVINDTSGDLIIQGTSGVATDVTVAGTGGHVFSITPANSVTIEDLSITNGGRGIYAHDGSGAVVVDNVVANGLTAAGVFLIRTGDVTIRNSQMNSDTVGIWMSDVGQVLVEDNQLDNHAQSGAVIDRATSVVVRNTTVSNNAISGLVATNLSGTIDLVNLTASDNVEHGSSVRGGSPTLSVTGGLFSGNDLYGIHFDAVSNATISDVEVTGNGAVDAAAGGIFASTSKPAAVITIQDSVVKDNVAAGSAGIYVGGTGRAQIERTTVTGNLATFSDVSDGGGVFIATSAAGNVIQDSLIQNNETTFGVGGGISHHSSGSLLVERTTVDGNRAVAGGGISQDQSATAALTIRESTISNNTATAVASSSVAVGGGGARLKTALIENSTFTGNTAGDDGGAIFVDVTAVDVQLVNSTVTLNSAGREGGGVYNNQSSIYLRGANSIFAGNTANSAGGPLSPDIRGDFGSGSGNLVGDIAGSTGVSLTLDLSGTAAALLDPRLAPLADNGGTTLTHNPYPDSPAIDGVNFATNYVLATDQRGVSRPQGSFRDIGAVEYTASAVNAANLLVTQNDTLFEFNADRQIVQSSVIPYPGGRDATNVARDVTIAADGKVHVYNGSIAPYLSTLDPATSFTTYTHDTHPDWNTTNIVEGGGAAAYENYVFVSDTGSSNAGGLIRFDTTTGDSLRFESGVSTYVDVNVGLDGLLYALNAYSTSGSRVDVFDITTLQKLSTVQLNARYVSVAADSDGRIYVGNVSGTIVRYGTSGSIDERLISNYGIIDLDVAADGRVAFGTQSNGVYLTNTTLDTPLPAGANSPTGPVAPTFVSFGSYGVPSSAVVISGIEFEDTNGNGVQDVGEPGLPGVTIYLDANENGALDSGEETRLTGSDGSYAFLNLMPGIHTVRQHLPTNHILTTEGNDPGVYLGTAYIVGSSGQMNYVEIDALTGEVSRIGAALSPGLQGLIRTNSGDVYGIHVYNSDRLYKVNRTDGTLTLVGDAGGQLVLGLAYDPVDDRIYGVGRLSSSPADPKYLLEIDRLTGQITELGPGTTGIDSVSEITFDPVNRRVIAHNNSDDVMFAFEPDGTPSIVSDLPDGAVSTWTLTYADGQYVYGGLGSANIDKIFSLDILTGATTAILTLSEAAPMEALNWDNDPSQYRFSLSAGQTVSNIDFGNKPGPDTTAPTSSVETLPFTATAKSFTVSVNGSDPGVYGQEQSDVASYDIQVANGGGSFQHWTTVTAASPSAVFTGTSNTFYSFRSVASDVAGNVESKPIGSETFIYVPDLDAPITSVTAVDSSTATFLIDVSGSDVSGSSLDLFQLYVQIDGGTAAKIADLAPSEPDAGGVSTAQTQFQATSDGVQHTYRFYSVGVDSQGNTEAAPAGAADDIVVTATFAPPPALDVSVFDVQKGAKQRSYIRYLDLLFNTDAGVQSILDTLDDADGANDRITLIGQRQFPR